VDGKMLVGGKRRTKGPRQAILSLEISCGGGTSLMG